SRMRAHSRVATRWRPGPDGSGTTCVSTLHAEAPLLLKTTRQKEPEPWPQLTGAARVSLTAAAAGPIGGDAYRLDVEVGAGSTLVLADVSPTVLLPGPDGAESSYTVTITVAEHATLVWLAEPLIAAHGCNHCQHIGITMHPSARLMMREELLLGRHGEVCGNVRQRITVRRSGATLHRQDLTVGHCATGFDGAAVLGGARAVGSVLTVDPVWEQASPRECVVAPSAAVLALAGPAALVTAVADDSLTLRRDLNTGLSELGPPWQPAWPTR
ncbi:MAG TPA: urease accessory protein UreD, partial [Mycobacterium sp.]|nr:urease accessory protein UreD [Mycobacterium sp.]